jgi:hypothetical protein
MADPGVRFGERTDKTNSRADPKLFPAGGCRRGVFLEVACRGSIAVESLGRGEDVGVVDRIRKRV